MIARERRMAISDILLVFSATLVIVLGIVGGESIRQNVLVRDSEGVVHHCWYDLEDPRLAKLSGQLQRWKGRSPDAALARSRWIAEAAAFYADQTRSSAQASAVMPVSYVLPEQAAKDDLRQQRTQHQHELWIRVAKEAEAQVDGIERQHRLAAGTPPIQFGPKRQAGPEFSEYALASLAGLFVAIAFVLWTHHYPALRLNGDSIGGDALKQADGSELLKLEIPAAWVKLHQPLSVVLRRVAFATTITAGLLSAVL